MADVISTRVLNRTLLARQHLLQRSTMPAHEMIEHLVGLQAQDVMPPFVGLWSRIVDFDHMEVSSALEDRSLARVTLMRGTIHMVTAPDALRLQPHFRDFLRAIPERPGFFFGALKGIDLEDIAGEAPGLFAGGPVKSADIRAWAKNRWPDRDSQAIAQAVYYLTPVLQVPPRGKWMQNGRPVWDLTASWLGPTPVEAYPIDDIVVRYLRAFGPASTMDMQTWSKLSGFREVIERLGSELRTYEDERGRVLYDVADGVLIDEDVDAPVRFLGWYDNIALSHQDRSRIVDPAIEFKNTESQVSVFTVDGFIAGEYKVVADKERSVLRIVPGRSLLPGDRQNLEDEGARLLSFMHPGLDHDVEYVKFAG